jgi:hypothetical protein
MGMVAGIAGTEINVYLYINIYHMRYKNNVLDKLVQTEAIINRVQLQVNRNVEQDQILESIDQLKAQIETVREIVSIEPDDLEQQFRG